jgi:hypothetical protein
MTEKYDVDREKIFNVVANLVLALNTGFEANEIDTSDMSLHTLFMTLSSFTALMLTKAYDSADMPQDKRDGFSKDYCEALSYALMKGAKHD